MQHATIYLLHGSHDNSGDAHISRVEHWEAARDFPVPALFVATKTRHYVVPVANIALIEWQKEPSREQAAAEDEAAERIRVAAMRSRGEAMFDNADSPLDGGIS